MLSCHLSSLLKQIEKDFGTYDRLKAVITKASKGVDGNGWGILGYHPSTDKLTVLQCENHEKLTQWGVIRILVIDVWEHSYYLKYRNRRAEFVDSLFGIIPSRTIGNMPYWPGWVGTL